MMDNQPPLTSPDGSSHGNPPERCPRPLYSRDSTQEGHTIPHHHQVDDDNYWNPPERCPRPLYSRDSTQEGHTIPHCYKVGSSCILVDLPEDVPVLCIPWIVGHTIPHHLRLMEPPNTRNPPERCPRPLYSRDST
ncbi:unnamed protein product, partial [Staurois parvus]